MGFNNICFSQNQPNKLKNSEGGWEDNVEEITQKIELQKKCEPVFDYLIGILEREKR